MNNFFVKLIKNPYVLNLLLAVVITCGLIYGTLKWLDKYTRHNEAVVHARRCIPKRWVSFIPLPARKCFFDSEWEAKIEQSLDGLIDK